MDGEERSVPYLSGSGSDVAAMRQGGRESRVDKYGPPVVRNLGRRPTLDFGSAANGSRVDGQYYSIAQQSALDSVIHRGDPFTIIVH